MKSDPLKRWRERREYLVEALKDVVDPRVGFAIEKDIERADEMIEQLEEAERGTA